MTWIFLFIFFIYFLLVFWLVMAWRRLTSRKTPPFVTDQVLVSIIIPVRNEEETIHDLLIDILKQSYKNFEVIVVNDHSDDRTEGVVIPFTMRDRRFRILQNSGQGKKSALTRGILASKGEIIITTDGDCRVGGDWLHGMLNAFQNSNTQLVFGSVRLLQDSFFSNLQALEFVSLIGTAAASASKGLPTMCNGANLAFRKSAFIEVEGYSGNFHIPSGDDEFLMRKVFSRFPEGISFSSISDTIVTTKAAKDGRAFFHQRIRWAGKWKVNQSFASRLLAVFIFCFQGSVILLPLAVILAWLNPTLAAALLLLKALLESVFLRKVARSLEVKWSWTIFLVLQIIYPLYVVVVGLISNVGSFEWKGRKLNSFTISPIKK